MRVACLVAVALLTSVTAQAARAADAQCLVQMERKDVLVGPCQATAPKSSGSVSATSPDGSLVFRIASKGGGVGEAFWNSGSGEAAAETLIGTVVLIGSCWASDKIKLCVTR